MATEPKDATETTNSPSATETNAEPTPMPQEPQPNAKSDSQPDHDATFTFTAESVPQQSTDGESALDALLAEDPSRNRSSSLVYASQFELPSLDENHMHLSRKQFRHSLMHDESLGVSTLGAPADAIIINNPNKVRRKRKAPMVLEVEPTMPSANLDWEQMASAKDDAELETQEIYDNINELRPDTHILKLSEIQKVIDGLCSGFTLSQLKDYHRDFKVEVDKTDIVDYPWIKEQVPWKPMNELRVRGTDKTALAQKIVFDTWKVEVQENLDDLGRARDFLVGEAEKISLTSNLCRINITARKSTTYGILAHIDQAVQRMQTRFIEVKSYLPPKLRPLPVEELAELGRLTKTSIQHIKEGEEDKLKVSWIPKIPKPDENTTETPETEDLADIVFRLIVGRTTPAFDNSLQCIPFQEWIDTPFIEVQRQNRAMSWRDKLRKWHRAVAPSQKSSKDSPKSINLAKFANLPEWEMPPSGNKDATTATFGHLVHSGTDVSWERLPRILSPLTPHPAAFSDAKPDDDKPLKQSTSRSRHILSPLTPHPAAFSALKPDGDKPLKQSTTIILNLVPHETHAEHTANRRTTKTRPPVCVKLPVDPDADLENFSIPADASAECLVPLHTNDVLLPHESVDVRLKHERSLSLDINQPGLKKFLEKSQFNLLQGRLRTPSQATLSMPKAWIDGNRGRCDKSGRTVEFLYDFRGLEIHQNIEMPWRNHTLRYSSIEAGQHGGQRQEITLQAGTPENDQVAFKGKAKKSFLQLVEDMATGKCFSWSEGYKEVKHRQLEDYSYNLPEEELTEDIIVDNDKFDEQGRLKPKRSEQEDIFEKEYAPRRHSRERGQSDKQDDTVASTRDIFDDIDEVLSREPETEKDTPTGTKDGSLGYQSFFDGILDSTKAIKDESDNSPDRVDAADGDVKPTNEETTSKAEPEKADELAPTLPYQPIPSEASPRKEQTSEEGGNKGEPSDSDARDIILQKLRPPQPEFTKPDEPSEDQKSPAPWADIEINRRSTDESITDSGFLDNLPPELRKYRWRPPPPHSGPNTWLKPRVNFDNDASTKTGTGGRLKPGKPKPLNFDADPFVRQFNLRATDEPSTETGFFDDLPVEPKKRKPRRVLKGKWSRKRNKT
ncbi:hypothetical protein NW762_007696 [Fusarium torreyae]|uniref:Uncharacterized protein n=1 Tax=Fusarium torreyae TaxID=1237075 RepID=A0A9W8RZ23_9HYPO|nr:hypothetical protein NW762_007696 [Fusarium torreyae]